MARLHVKGLQWLGPPATYAHGNDDGVSALWLFSCCIR